MPTTLFVANLSEFVTEGDLESLFARYGSVVSVKIWIDLETGKSRGFGFVELDDDWGAERAIEKLNGKRLYGQRLKVQEARPRQN